MRKTRPIRWLLAALIVSLPLLSACTSSDRFSAGRPVTPDELTAPEESTREVETWNPDADYPEDTVFWTSNGAGYHINSRCPRLARADQIYVGTLDDAHAASKTRECSACTMESETRAVTEYHTETSFD